MDSEYIEMNRALPREILDLWEPEVGDRILNKTALNYNKKKGREILDPVEFLSIEHFSASCEDRIKEWAIPLYRQEDLQEIARKNLSKTTWGLTVLFYGFFKEKCAVNKITNRLNANEPLNTVWLCFVMETCYQKRWDTETKKWVEKHHSYPTVLKDPFGVR